MFPKRPSPTMAPNPLLSLPDVISCPSSSYVATRRIFKELVDVTTIPEDSKTRGLSRDRLKRSFRRNDRSFEGGGGGES